MDRKQTQLNALITIFNGFQDLVKAKAGLLLNVVNRPKINSLFSRREVPENLWTKCAECGTMLFHRELSENLNVCTHCDHHMGISPRARMEALFDGGIFVEVDVPKPITDPLHFRDQKKYPDRMKAAQKKTGEAEAMLVVEGEMGRTGIVAACQDFAFMGGSMGIYVGCKALVFIGGHGSLSPSSLIELVKTCQSWFNIGFPLCLRILRWYVKQ